MASDEKKAVGKKHIDPSEAIKKHLMEQPSKKKPEYLVRGALLHCRCGSYARRLNLSKDHAIYMTEHPVIHELNCICGEGKNITPFGVCRSSRPPETEIITCEKDIPRGPNGEPTGPAPGGVDIGRKCSPVIIGMSWKNSYGKSRIVDNGEHNPSDRAAFTKGKGTIKGEATVTTRSFLICQYGGLIEPITSGQEYTDSTLLTTEDAIEFGKDSDTYLILQDIQNRWNNKVDEHTLEYYQNLADEVRTAARNGTPYKYGQEKIKQIMHDNAAFITDPVLNFTNGRLGVYTLYVLLTETAWDYKKQKEWQVPYEYFPDRNNGFAVQYMDETYTETKILYDECGNPFEYTITKSANRRNWTPWIYFEGDIISGDKFGNINLGYVGAKAGFWEPSYKNFATMDKDDGPFVEWGVSLAEQGW